MELYWSYTGVVILLFNAFACICQWGCAGGRSPAAGCRRPKDGAGQRPGVAGLEFLGLARCVGFAGWKRSSPEAQPVCVGVGWNGWSFWAWLVALDGAVGRGQAQKPSQRGGKLKFLKFLKFLL